MTLSEINRKIDALSNIIGFTKMLVLPYSDKFSLDSLKNLEKSFDLSGTGYYEWQQNGDHIYITDLMFKYCNTTTHYRGNFITLLKNTLAPEKLLEFLTNLKERFSTNNAKSTVILEIYSQSHKSFRWFNLTSDVVNDSVGQIQTIHGFMQDITDMKLAHEQLEDSEAILFQILNTIPLAVIYTDENDVIKFLNDAALNFSSDIFEIKLGDTFDDYIEQFKSYVDSYNLSPLVERDDYRQYRMDFDVDSKFRNIVLDNIPIFNSNSDAIGEITVMNDITEDIDNKLQLKKLLKANELSIEIKDMIEKVDDLALVYDVILHKIKDIIPNAVKGCILLLDENENLSITSSVGYEEDYVKTFSLPFIESFAHNDLKGNFTRSIIVDNVYDRYKDVYPEISNTKRGFRLQSNITSPITINNALYGILSIDSAEPNAFDELDLNLIEYLKIQIERTINRHNKYLNAMMISRIDPLTSAYNRRHLLEVFNSYVDNATWQSESFSFVVFDLDGLKTINDVHGHLAGDQVILQFSKTVIDKIRSSDVFARYGGDEFVCLFFKGMTDVLDQKIISWRDSLNKNPILLADGSEVVTKFSYGVANYPDDGVNFKTLMSIADKRMYVYKKAKKEAALTTKNK